MKQSAPLLLALASAPAMADDKPNELTEQSDLFLEREIFSNEQNSPVGLRLYQVRENVFRWEDSPPANLVVQENTEEEEASTKVGWYFTL